MSAKKDIPVRQRALVLQGGGALGAYQAGAIRVLCEFLSDKDKKNNENQRNGPLFDIVAGTSIGAMNAAVLVSNVVSRKKTWKEAAEVLERFWRDDAKEEEKEDEKKGGLSSTPDFSNWWWNKAKRQNMFHAEPEHATRYYSVKEYFKHGASNVFSSPIPKFDSKFGDQDNLWLAYSSKPLQETIERYSKDNDNNENKGDLRIATTWDKREQDYLSSAWT